MFGYRALQEVTEKEIQFPSVMQVTLSMSKIIVNSFINVVTSKKK